MYQLKIKIQNEKKILEMKFMFHTLTNDQKECWYTHKERCDNSQEPVGAQDKTHSLLFLLRKFGKIVEYSHYIQASAKL